MLNVHCSALPHCVPGLLDALRSQYQLAALALMIFPMLMVKDQTGNHDLGYTAG